MLLVILILATLATGGLQQIIGGQQGGWLLPEFHLVNLLLGLGWLGFALILGWIEPVILLYSLAFFTFFTAWRPIDLPIGSFTASQIFSILAITIISLRYRTHNWGNKKIRFLMLILLAAMVASSIELWFSNVKDTFALPVLREGRGTPLIRSITSIGSIMIGMSAYFVTVDLLKTPARFKTAMKCWFGGALFSILAGVYSLIRYYAPMLPPLPLPALGVDGTGVVTRGLDFAASFEGQQLVTRISSFAYEPRHLALMLAPPLCFLLVLLILSPLKKRVEKRHLFILTVTMIIGFTLTTSRTSYLLVIIMIAIIIWSTNISSIHRLRRLIFMFSLTAAILMVIYYINYEINPVSFIFSQMESLNEMYNEESGIPLAIAGAQVAWDMFTSNPIIGRGWGSYIYYMSGYDYLFVLSPTPPNLFFLMIAETGIVGTIILVCLFVEGQRGASGPRHSAFAQQFPILPCLGAALLACYFGFLFWSPIHDTYLWMLLGFLQAARELTYQGQFIFPDSLRGFRLAVGT